MIFAEASEWTWLFNQGFAVAIVVAIGFSAYRFCVWAGVKIIEPLKDAAVQHLETVGSTLTDASESMKKINVKLDGLDGRQIELIKSNTDLIKSHDGFLLQSFNDRQLLHKNQNQFKEDLEAVVSRVEKLEDRNQ